MMDVDFDVSSKMRKKTKTIIFVGSGEFFNGFIVRLDDNESLGVNVKVYARWASVEISVIKMNFNLYWKIGKKSFGKKSIFWAMFVTNLEK
jgi:hypothetical protein